MTQAPLRPVVPLYDGDQSWLDYDGTIRLRYNPAFETLQLLVSVPDGSGGFKISTFNLEGSLRDTRASETEWPAYVTANLPTPFISPTERDAEAVLAATNRHAIRTSGPTLPPVSGHSAGN